jgi:hypothetical protein
MTFAGIEFMAVYDMSYPYAYRPKGPQRRAMRLLRTLLTAEQRRVLRAGSGFYMTGSLGGRYRLFPACGVAWRVERHGKLEIHSAAYCLHDPELELPPADVTVQHLLLLRSDEEAFLRRANIRLLPHMGWDSEWMRHHCHANKQRRARASREVVDALRQAA